MSGATRKQKESRVQGPKLKGDCGRLVESLYKNVTLVFEVMRSFIGRIRLFIVYGYAKQHGASIMHTNILNM